MRADGGAASLTIKSVARLAGGSTSYAYAIKAGPWIFLTGHEAFDFERGPAPEVEGPPGYPLSGRPPLRREADYILARMRAILKDFGADLPDAVRVDQYYTNGAAVLTDMRDFAGISAAWADRHGQQPHPFACVQVPAPFPAAGACVIGDFWIYAG